MYFFLTESIENYLFWQQRALEVSHVVCDVALAPRHVGFSLYFSWSVGRYSRAFSSLPFPKACVRNFLGFVIFDIKIQSIRQKIGTYFIELQSQTSIIILIRYILIIIISNHEIRSRCSISFDRLFLTSTADSHSALFLR